MNHAPFAKPAFRLWILCLALAAAILVDKPWGGFSWYEWLAIAAPLSLIHPAVRRIAVLATGVMAAGLAWLVLGDYSEGWLELFCLVAVFAIGTNVGHIATRKNQETDPRDAVPDDESVSEQLFLDAVNRELCRVRRDPSAFVVLSLDVEEEQSEKALDDVFGMLDSGLRAYADIAQYRGRVLALVPDVQPDQCEPFLARLKQKWNATQASRLRIGLAHYPEDEICAEDLIGFADRKRLESGSSPILPDTQLHPGTQVSA